MAGAQECREIRKTPSLLGTHSAPFDKEALTPTKALPLPEAGPPSITGLHMAFHRPEMPVTVRRPMDSVSAFLRKQTSTTSK